MGASPRVQRNVGRVTATCLFTFISAGWYVAAWDIGYLYFWKVRGIKLYTGIWMALVTLLVLTLYRAFFHLLLLPSLHCAPPSKASADQNLPPQVLARSIPIQCASTQPAGAVAPHESLELEYCWKDQCQGAWKPGKARHCSVCGRCRVGFDHHCPWFNNCLTLPHMKAFLLLILLTPLAIFVIALPPYFLVVRDFGLVWTWIWSPKDAYMHTVWWDRWYSWLTGPVGRWGIGVVWGYWKFPQEALLTGGDRSPRLLYLFMFYLAVIFAVVTLGIGVTALWKLWTDELTVDYAKRRGYEKQVKRHSKALGSTGDAIPPPKPPTIKLFVPDLNSKPESIEPSNDQNTTSAQVYSGTVIEVAANYREASAVCRDDDGHTLSMMKAIWQGPCFPEYVNCDGGWTRERVGDTLRLQGYL